MKPTTALCCLGFFLASLLFGSGSSQSGEWKPSTCPLWSWSVRAERSTTIHTARSPLTSTPFLVVHEIELFVTDTSITQPFYFYPQCVTLQNLLTTCTTSSLWTEAQVSFGAVSSVWMISDLYASSSCTKLICSIWRGRWTFDVHHTCPLECS